MPRSKKRTRIPPSGMLLALLAGTVVVPSVLTLSVGIVALALWQEATGLVIGVLTLSFAASAIAGGISAVIFVRRSARLSEMQAEFVSNVSHQLRTPLAGLMLVAETFEAGHGEDAARRALLVEMLGDEVRRLDVLIARILTWRRLDEGAPQLVRELLEVGPVVDESVRRIARLPEARRATISVSLAEELPRVLGDPEMLTQAVSNLIHNGVKFAGARGPIVVSASRVDGHVLIAVRDSGPGIGEEERQKVFNRFYQAPEHRRVHVGTGLGLAIVKHIAEAHKGHVELATALGSGSTFALWLPEAEESANGG